VVNHDQSRSDYAFSMIFPPSKEDLESGRVPDGLHLMDWKAQSAQELSAVKHSMWGGPDIPCVMISWNAGQVILEDKPERLRLYPGGGRPFIESVRESSPVLLIIHNMLTSKECSLLKEKAQSSLRPVTTAHDNYFRENHKSGGKPATIKRQYNTTVLHNGLLRMHALIEGLNEKIVSIINVPSSHFGDLEVFLIIPFFRISLF
jgi:hypothetical protein